MNEICNVRLASLVQETPIPENTHSRRTTGLPIITVKRRWLTPPEYTDFEYVFSTEAVEQLLPHSAWNYEILMLHGTQLLPVPIYLLSLLAQRALREYLDDIIASGKIRPSRRTNPLCTNE